MKPTLGYPSRIAAICAFRRQRLTEREIAAKLGIKPNTVTSLECRARARGWTGQSGKRAGVLRMAGEALVELQEAAIERGTTPAHLARRLLTTIARDGLIDAVLDDRP